MKHRLYMWAACIYGTGTLISVAPSKIWHWNNLFRELFVLWFELWYIALVTKKDSILNPKLLWGGIVLQYYLLERWEHKLVFLFQKKSMGNKILLFLWHLVASHMMAEIRVLTKSISKKKFTRVVLLSFCRLLFTSLVKLQKGFAKGEACLNGPTFLIISWNDLLLQKLQYTDEWCESPDLHILNSRASKINICSCVILIVTW